jgi:tyrosine-protein phosphatase YwqE
MKWFDRKKRLPSDFFQGATDMHSHLLPGVDDGFQTMEATEEGLRYLYGLGFRQLILTPHIMTDYGENCRPFLEQRFTDFLQGTEMRGMTMRLAAEYMLDEQFLAHGQEGWLYLNPQQRFILVETSYMYKCPDMEQYLYELASEDDQVVIAHPERYRYASMDDFQRWRNNGYALQLNLISLAGGYGRPAKEIASYLLEADMYDYVGTDLHKISTFEQWLPELELRTRQVDMLHRLYDNNAVLFGNPQ